MILSLEEIIEKIIEETGLSRKEIFERINKIKEELGAQFISDEGAAHIVARELGVNVFSSLDMSDFTAPATKIASLEVGASRVSLIGRVLNIFNVRQYQTKDKKTGKVGSLLIADETDKIRLVLWNEKTEIIEKKQVKRGDIIKIDGATVRENNLGNIELHVGNYGVVTVLDKDSAEHLPAIPLIKKTLDEINPYEYGLELEGTLVRKISKSNFKKDDDFGLRISFVFADSKAQIRCVAWNSAAEIIDKLDEGTHLKLMDVRSRPGLDGNIEIHIDSKKSIEILAKDKSPTQIKFHKLNELSKSILDVNVQVFVLQDPDIRTFKRKDGSEGERIYFTVADDTAKINVIAWNENVNLLKNIKKGDFIQLLHCSVRVNNWGFLELVVVRDTEIRTNISPSFSLDDVDQLPFMRSMAQHIEIAKIVPNAIVTIKGIVVGVYNKLVIYNACPNCNLKLDKIEGKWLCANCGEIKKPKRRLVLRIILDDETGTIPVSLIGDLAEQVIDFSATEIDKLLAEGRDVNEILTEIKSTLLGNYLVIEGRSHLNKFTNTLELIAKNIYELDPEKEAEFIFKEIIKNN